MRQFSGMKPDRHGKCDWQWCLVKAVGRRETKATFSNDDFKLNAKWNQHTNDTKCHSYFISIIYINPNHFSLLFLLFLFLLNISNEYQYIVLKSIAILDDIRYLYAFQLCDWYHLCEISSLDYAMNLLINNISFWFVDKQFPGTVKLIKWNERNQLKGK